MAETNSGKGSRPTEHEDDILDGHSEAGEQHPDIVPDEVTTDDEGPVDEEFDPLSENMVGFNAEDDGIDDAEEVESDNPDASEDEDQPQQSANQGIFASFPFVNRLKPLHQIIAVAGGGTALALVAVISIVASLTGPGPAPQQANTQAPAEEGFIARRSQEQQEPINNTSDTELDRNEAANDSQQTGFGDPAREPEPPANQITPEQQALIEELENRIDDLEMAVAAMTPLLNDAQRIRDNYQLISDELSDRILPLVESWPEQQQQNEVELADLASRQTRLTRSFVDMEEAFSDLQTQSPESTTEPQAEAPSEDAEPNTTQQTASSPANSSGPGQRPAYYVRGAITDNQNPASNIAIVKRRNSDGNARIGVGTSLIGYGEVLEIRENWDIVTEAGLVRRTTY